VGSGADVSQRATPIVSETATDVKKPPTVFIVDNRPGVLKLLEAAVKSHDFLVQCYSSAAQFIADQDLNRVGCVLIDPLIAVQGDVVLRWLHESGSLLSVVLISGLIESSRSVLEARPPASVALKPHEDFALMTMVSDGLAGSISRQVIRDRSAGSWKG
jgi:two-component system, LuxR family, response regulator FixJ